MKLTGWCNFIVLLPTLGEKNTSNHRKNQVGRKSFFLRPKEIVKEGILKFYERRRGKRVQTQKVTFYDLYV